MQINFCKKCGNKLKGNEKFCGACGASLETVTPQNAPVDKKKDNKKIKIIAGAAVVFLAIILGIFLAVGNPKKAKEYDNLVASADKYVEEMNYEMAEATYLEAIEIDSKQMKAYVKLADVYLKQGKYDDAEEIIDKMEDEGATGDEESEERKEELVEVIIQKDNFIDFTWVVDPTIEVENLYYLKEDYMTYPSFMNVEKKQFACPQVIFEKNGLQGLMDISGNIVVEAEYKNMSILGNSILMYRNKPAYEPQYGMEWSLYEYYDNHLLPADGIGGPGSEKIFYINGLYIPHPLEDSVINSVPNIAFPIQKVDSYAPDIYEQTSKWYEEASKGKYAVYYGGRLVTDFIYDECGSYANGLLAVCKDGKWGYVNENGEIVIPLEYDASWNKYFLEYEYETDTYFYEDFCYSASSGFVALCKGDRWELRDVSGRLVIPSGIFEEILPVYEGRCWVKQNGKWGIISLDGNVTVVEDKEVETDGFTVAQLDEMRKALGAPVEVEAVQYNRFYWDAGERWLITVEFKIDGEVVAGASFDADTGEMVKNILMYSE